MAEKPKYPVLDKIGIYLKPFLNGRFLVAYLIPFAIVNLPAGIAFGLFMAGVRGVLITAGMTWFAILWGPTPEKLVTIPVAIWIHTKLFKHDPKTRAALDRTYNEAKKDWLKFKTWGKRKK